MKILVTGSNGFMGRHLTKRLDEERIEYFSFDIENNDDDLKKFIKESDFVVHLAGVMRPLTIDEFYKSNSNLTKKIVDYISLYNPKCKMLLASSTQASLNNDYGITKKMAEDYVLNSEIPCYIYRFTNAFGKWGKPNYNSVASTFFYNISHDKDIFVRDENFVVHFIYIDDIVDSIVACIKGLIVPSKRIFSVEPVFDCSIGNLANIIKRFYQNIKTQTLPTINNEFEADVFVTFLDYYFDYKVFPNYKGATIVNPEINNGKILLCEGSNSADKFQNFRVLFINNKKSIIFKNND